MRPARTYLIITGRSGKSAAAGRWPSSARASGPGAVTREPHMVTVGMNYRVLAGKESAFEAMFRKVLAVMGEASGHSSSRLYREVADPAQYLIISDWSDRAQFEAFLASAQFRKVADWGREQILAGRPTHEYYER